MEKGEMGVFTNEYGVSLGSNENVLELDSCMIVQI